MTEQTFMPMWLVAAGNQRAARIEEALAAMPENMANLAAGVVITSFLTEPRSEADLDTWDSSCDNCGKFLPGRLRTAEVNRVINNRFKLVLTVGACSACWGLE